MRNFLAAGLALVAMPALAQQPPPQQLALHNGSVMAVEPYGNKQVTIRYVQPRLGLWEVGVRPGTVLINGQWIGDALNATAFAFPPFPCPPVPYAVRGTVTPDGVLTLIGPAPLIDPYACAIIGMVWSANSTLVFLPQ